MVAGVGVWWTTSAGASDRLAQAADLTIARCRDDVDRAAGPFHNVDAPGTADLIVFIEEPVHKFRTYVDRLLSNRVVREYHERCYAYDWEDGPCALLPGVYPSISSRRADPAHAVGGGFVLPYNEPLIALADAGIGRAATPAFLYTFNGNASSHPVRIRLRELGASPQISFSTSWFDHGDDELSAYAAQLCAGKFVLCPRGIGPATFRVYEAMALGRAPVIVSDDWFAPVGPDWESFAIRVAENRVHEIPDLLRARESEWETMGRRARHAWECWFARPAATRGMLEAIDGIRKARDLSVSSRRPPPWEQWTSSRFRWSHGWTLPQRVMRRLTA